jgi:hypothetical protein
MTLPWVCAACTMLVHCDDLLVQANRNYLYTYKGNIEMALAHVVISFQNNKKPQFGFKKFEWLRYT